MRTTIQILIGLSIFLTNHLYGQHPMSVRLSIKVIVNPIDGTNPPGFTESKADSVLMQVNNWMNEYHRGMTFVNEGYFYIGGIGDSISQQYYNVPLGGIREQIEDKAENTPVPFEWREDHINIYVIKRNGGTLGGACSFPHYIRDENVVIAHTSFNPRTVLHELGHYFDLRHTHTGQVDGNVTSPGKADGIGETIFDHVLYNSYDNMSMGNYGLLYNQIDVFQQDSVVNTFDNIMSYHGAGRSILTEQQLDRWHKTIRNWSTRQDVVSGLPYYVDYNGSDPCDILAPSPCGCLGKPDVPFEEVDCALDEVNTNGTDVILINPGTYDVTNNGSVISQPVFMTATRKGDVILK